MNKKRIAMALLLLPITLSLMLFGTFMEWFHFRVSSRLLRACRETDKRLHAFFARLDKQ